MLYIMSMVKEEKNIPLEWCMEACIQCAYNSSTYQQDETT